MLIKQFLLQFFFVKGQYKFFNDKNNTISSKLEFKTVTLVSFKIFKSYQQYYLLLLGLIFKNYLIHLGFFLLKDCEFLLNKILIKD